MERIAITREVSPAIGRCELTHRSREPIDVERAVAQHRAYERCLSELGCDVRRLPASPELADSVFVEDTAVVLDEVAVIARPGARSRRPEIHAVARALAPHRRLVHVEAPATLDGGDVLQVGRTIFVGLSRRTDRAGVERLRALLAPFGYRVREVPVTGCLHLKSAATLVADDTLLTNPAWVDAASLAPCSTIDVDPAEPYAANVLRIDRTVMVAAGHERTRRRLARHVIDTRPVEVSELARAEGGLTCCSLVFRSA